jgi:hypothetical protein
MQSRNSNLKILTKLLHTKDKYYLIIGILGLIIIGLCIYLFLSSSNSKKTYLEKFYEDTQQTTTNNNDTANTTNTPATTVNYVASAPTVANKDTTCKNNTNIVSVCKSYENCCKTSTSQTNDCFCKHPYITNCYQSYESCITGEGGDKTNCQEILDNCCNKYLDTDILTTNFEKPINASQTGNQLCSISGIPNFEQRCMELCQTNTNCKSYSLVSSNNLPGTCNLYDTINYTKAKPRDNTIYVVKK